MRRLLHPLAHHLALPYQRRPCPALRLLLPLSSLLQVRLPALLQLPLVWHQEQHLHLLEVLYLLGLPTVPVLECLQSKLYIQPLLILAPQPLYQTQLFQRLLSIRVLLICTLPLHRYFQRLQLRLLLSQFLPTMAPSTHHSLQEQVQASVGFATIVRPTQHGASSLLGANLPPMDPMGALTAATSLISLSPMSQPLQSTAISTTTTGTPRYQS